MDKLMQKRKENSGPKKGKTHSQTLPNTPKHAQTGQNQTQIVQARPTLSEFVQLSYNAQKQLNEPASTGKALITARHTNCTHCR